MSHHLIDLVPSLLPLAFLTPQPPPQHTTEKMIPANRVCRFMGHSFQILQWLMMLLFFFFLNAYTPVWTSSNVMGTKWNITSWLKKFSWPNYLSWEYIISNSYQRGWKYLQSCPFPSCYSISAQPHNNFHSIIKYIDLWVSHLVIL